jgi:GNAT superfamily N-acetyltransferase
MPIRIRRAVKEDCPRLLELVQELATYERAPNEVTVTLEHFSESGFGDKPVWWAFVALAPGQSPQTKSGSIASEKIIGFALYYIRYSTWKGQAMYLEDILVTESMRGKGIGKLLFDRLIEEAREKKLPRIVWQVLEWNEPALNFYKKYNADLDPEWVNCSIYV